MAELCGKLGKDSDEVVWIYSLPSPSFTPRKDALRKPKRILFLDKHGLLLPIMIIRAFGRTLSVEVLASFLRWQFFLARWAGISNAENPGNVPRQPV
jgi:hypothetical protein